MRVQPGGRFVEEGHIGASDEGGGEQLPLYYKPDPFVLPQTSATSTPSNHSMSERTGILPNLDFPAGPTYYMLGIDIPFFTPIFVMSRITGWTAHIMEQLSSNALIRPLSAYVGPEQRSVPTR